MKWLIIHDKVRNPEVLHSYVYSVSHIITYPSKELCSKMALGEGGCHFHDDATPLSFKLQVTEDFF